MKPAKCSLKCRRAFFVTTLFAVPFIFGAASTAAADPPDRDQEEVNLSPARVPGDKVPGQYIVVLKDNTADVGRAASEIAQRVGGQVGHTYTAALKGFVCHIPPHAYGMVERIRQDPRVLFYEQDGVAQALDHAAAEIPTGINRINAELNPKTSAGTGLGVAVIDTGIQRTHPDLNVVGGITFLLFGNNKNNKNGNDDNGHGTHVAGTIGSKDNGVGVVGVSPGVDLYAVKVLDRNGSGFWSDIVRGIDWVTQNKAKIVAANMSLGGPGSDDGNCGLTNGDSVHLAICNSVKAGVVYVVAAGNSAADAANSRPAAYDEVITVSALADSDGKPNGTGSATSYGADDTFATFSNFGPDVDIISPGVNIRSTYFNSSYATLSGTSMATPHVTGSVALWIAKNGRPATGDAKDPVVRTIINQISEPLGSFKGDPDGFAEPMLNSDTTAAGGTGSSVCCQAP